MFKEIKNELFEVYKFRYVTLSFVQTSLKLRYRRSFLGFIWTVLAPMLNYLVMGIVFTFLMHNTMPNYFAYYFSGAIFFAIISATLNRAPFFLISNEHYIKKIYIPKMLFVLNGTAYEIVNFFLSATSLILIGALTNHLSLSWHAVLTIIPLVLISVFLIGLGCLISIATVYFRDLMHIVPVLVQMSFFVTPVIYEKKAIPTEYHFLVDYNPLYYFLEIYRQPLIYHQIPPYYFYLFCFIISMVVGISGIYFIKIFDNRIVFKL